jgi:hypothetical protein
MAALLMVEEITHTMVHHSEQALEKLAFCSTAATSPAWRSSVARRSEAAAEKPPDSRSRRAESEPMRACAR